MRRDEAPKRCVVLDIDGVIADVRHRLRFVASKPKNWHAFFAAAPKDPPLDVGVRFAREAASSHEIVYLTGRPERTRDDTLAWLREHDLPDGELIMRRERDRRPAVLTKTQALRTLAKTRRVELVVDDDPVVVESLRTAGFPVRLADWMPRADTLADAQEHEGRT
jgi:hypothetical protein